MDKALMALTAPDPKSTLKVPRARATALASRPSLT